MLIGERLRALREAKGLSQGDIEKSTGLFAAMSHELRTIIRPRLMVPKALQLLNSPGHARFMKKLSRALSRMQEREHCAEVGLAQETGSQLISSRGRAGLGLPH